MSTRRKKLNKKKVYKWSALAILASFAIALYNGWILLPGFYKDSYFRFNVPEGIETMGNDSVLTILIRKDVEIRVFARCHHYPFQDHSQLISDKCWIRVFLEGSKLKFADHTNFFVEDISWWKQPHQIDLKVKVFKSEKEWAQLSFKDSRHPNSIQLYIPAVTIEGKLINVPVLTGNFVKKIKFSFGW